MHKVLVLVMMWACGAGADAPAAPGEMSTPARATALNRRVDVGVDDLKAAKEAGTIVLLDVRSPAEFADGHVPGAVNVPLGQLQPSHEAWSSLAEGATVYTICAVGGRSAKAADRLAAAGLNALNVDGGTVAWKARGFPVE